MPIDTPVEPGAAARAADRETGFWAELAERWSPSSRPEPWSDRPALEVDVVVFHDPAGELDRRAARWGHTLDGHGLDALARFAAGLANAEAEAWRFDQPDIATRAFEERRFLVADRILHWAVPWLDTMGRRHPPVRVDAGADRDGLLDLAESMRPAPRLTGSEGVYPAGEDAYGPVRVDVPLSRWLASLWSGALLPHGDERPRDGSRDDALAAHYGAEAMRWHRLAAAHPGSAALWLDLGERAARTSNRLSLETGPGRRGSGSA